jgi:hypothetical protein
MVNPTPKRDLRTGEPAWTDGVPFPRALCFGESPYGLPAIAPVPGAERCFAVVGFGGNGTRLLQRMLLRLPDPDAALFGFRS